MATLFLMCGLSFAGKTTTTHRLAKLQGAEVISLDEINRERGLGSGGDGLISSEQWRRTHEIAMARLAAQMKSNVNLVIDDTNCFRFLRDRYRALASQHGYRTLVVLMKVPFAELERRRQQNDLLSTRHHIQGAVLKRLIDAFEWPGDDEETLCLRSAYDFPES